MVPRWRCTVSATITHSMQYAAGVQGKLLSNLLVELSCAVFTAQPGKGTGTGHDSVGKRVEQPDYAAVLVFMGRLRRVCGRTVCLRAVLLFVMYAGEDMNRCQVSTGVAAV